ncbi:signal peptidase I [Bacillus sp. EAC]|uniref:signal peptidase I n=1 Tax=Bacillus sp. EAC TaxID=1978338 RepID=UPI000B42EFFF|nr:signal peptidase I [Bacillus sp. EAC]
MKRYLFIIGMCLTLVGCQHKEKSNTVEIIKDTTTLDTIPIVKSAGLTEIEYLYDGMDRGHHDYEGTLVIDTSYYNKNKFQRGEVVYYTSPKSIHKNVARVVGLPGEKVEIKNGQLFINDHKLDSFYAKTMNRGISDFITYRKWMKATGNTIIGENNWKEYFKRSLNPVIIKDNEVFILADNGWRVSDSFDFGPLSHDNIEGKVLGMTKTR